MDDLKAWLSSSIAVVLFSLACLVSYDLGFLYRVSVICLTVALLVWIVVMAYILFKFMRSL